MVYFEIQKRDNRGTRPKLAASSNAPRSITEYFATFSISEAKEFAGNSLYSFCTKISLHSKIAK